MTKRALITGITGQDGSYLSELLIEKGYEVHGIIRRSSSINTERIDHLYHDPHEKTVRLILHYGDLTDGSSLRAVISQVQPDEIYNLGAQSHVAVSFESPEYTANSDALGTLRILEAVRMLGLTQKTRIYQASTFPGSPVPHAFLTNQSGEVVALTDLIEPGSFLLITGETGQPWVDAAAAVSAQSEVGIRAVRIGHAAGDLRDHRLSWLRRRGVSAEGAVLVRPDGVVAWRSDGQPSDPQAALQEVMNRVLMVD